MAGELGHIRMSEYSPVGYGKGESFEGYYSGRDIAQIGMFVARELLQQGGTLSFAIIWTIYRTLRQKRLPNAQKVVKKMH